MTCQWERCTKAASVVFTVAVHARGKRIESRFCWDHHARASRDVQGESRLLAEDFDDLEESHA